MDFDIEVVLDAPTTADLHPWTDGDYESLLEMIKLSRQLVDSAPGMTEYAELLASLEAQRAEVEAARSEP